MADDTTTKPVSTESIVHALVKAGVASDKIQTSAFGEQKPLCNESTDACWQRDRRVDVGFRTGN